ncbi:hypothetical protein G5V59_19270 [Nocardioides sp. W3-2-3]|uniref:hypothetical protein n=1 Tax=Nocardioides convexus TaxID=2712224 RepID=UPI002418A3FC|nr:hypothetical protein [Nocardioides convexus]NHA01270.1 hypothetical protein [Nocardioides convexus]
MDTLQVDGADGTWDRLGSIALLLYQAATQVWSDADRAAADSPLHDLGLGVYLAHDQASALLPEDYESPDLEVDELEERTPLQLLTEAEEPHPAPAAAPARPGARLPGWSSTCATSSGKPAALATDLRLAYADIDSGLFDVDQIPMTSRDVRSVGEMLFDVDYLARQPANGRRRRRGRHAAAQAGRRWSRPPRTCGRPCPAGALASTSATGP